MEQASIFAPVPSVTVDMKPDSYNPGSALLAPVSTGRINQSDLLPPRLHQLDFPSHPYKGGRILPFAHSLQPDCIQPDSP